MDNITQKVAKAIYDADSHQGRDSISEECSLRLAQAALKAIDIESIIATLRFYAGDRDYPLKVVETEPALLHSDCQRARDELERLIGKDTQQ